MDKINNILSGFTDYELAVFRRYKLKEYMTDTQNIIIDYIKNKRNLDEHKLESLIAEKPVVEKSGNSVHCPNCHSKKLLKTKVKWRIPAFRAGYEDEYASWKELTTGQATYKDKVECFVCGHVLYDPNNEKRPFYKKLLDLIFDQPLPI